jgi:hypothetical protein
MVRIHARQITESQVLALEFERILNDVLGHFYRSELIFFSRPLVFEYPVSLHKSPTGSFLKSATQKHYPFWSMRLSN